MKNWMIICSLSLTTFGPSMAFAKIYSPRECRAQLQMIMEEGEAREGRPGTQCRVTMLAFDHASQLLTYDSTCAWRGMVTDVRANEQYMCGAD